MSSKTPIYPGSFNLLSVKEEFNAEFAIGGFQSNTVENKSK